MVDAASPLFLGFFFFVARRFVYTAEGFCFIDYYDDAINTVFLLSMLVSMFQVWYYTFETRKILKQKEGAAVAEGRGVVPPANSVFIFAFFFTLYYVCGYPLVIQGYKQVNYSDKLQITSGLLAHGAELINPFIYGILWCRWFLQDDEPTSSSEKVNPVEPVQAQRATARVVSLV